MVLRIARGGIFFAAAAVLVASPALADSTFPAPAYSSANCTPQGSTFAPGIGPQQWNASVGLPLTPTGTPAEQRIVVGEFDETANQASVTALLSQCGLSNVIFSTDTNTWYPAVSTPGAEATLDASVVAAALPANAEMVLVNTATNTGWYGLLSTVADACGLIFSGDPTVGLQQLSRGPDYPAGGCIASISYGGTESAYVGSLDKNAADWMMTELEQNGVIVVLSAGDEGSGGCMAVSGTNFGNGVQRPVASVSVASNIMTVNSTAHGFSQGQQVFLGAIGPTLDRMYPILSTTTNAFTVGVNYADTTTTATSGAFASVNFGGLVPQFLASNPGVLAVGGTQWDSQVDSMANGLDIAYVPGATVQNYTWKDTSANTNCANLPAFPTSGGEATGGGQSTLYDMPAYQQAAAFASYPSALSKRMMPDLAALAGWPAYGIANWGIPIEAAGVNTNVASLYFPSPTSMAVGEAVVVSGMVAPFTALNGTHTITAVNGIEVRFSLATGDVMAQYVGAGTATQACVNYPCDPATFPWSPVVGTSAATPLVAVGIANVNAVLTARGLTPITNDGGSMDIHSIVYGTAYRSAFTDVVYGNNDLHGLGGWDALTGYDMATGMGVPNFTTLASLLIAEQTPAPAPSGGGSSSPAPQTSAATPVTQPSETSEVPVVILTATPSVTMLGPGVLASTGPAAATAPRVRASGTASTSRRGRPMAEMKPNRWAVPVVRVPAGAKAVTVRARIEGSWVVLGTFDVSPTGLVALPAMRVSRVGQYPLRLATGGGETWFAGLRVS